jgi:hypothetical protein
MNEVLLTDVIKKTREAVQSFGYSQSTMRHYERYWRLEQQFRRIWMRNIF